jgi:cytochrome c oxidase cbb3-type subunit 3
MPRWWLYSYYACIAFAIGYAIYYPAWPGSTSGAVGGTLRQIVAEDIAEHTEGQAEWRDKINAASLDEILEDEQLLTFASSAGKAAFGVNCSQCHGSGAQGFVGYPNLNDDAWLWGGSLEDIYLTIKHGVRNEDSDDARYSEMPAFGELLEKDEIADVTQYVLSLGDLDHDTGAAQRGVEVYGENCSACHGEAGQGDPEQGAPRLNDAIWLFGGNAEQISAQIKQPAHGVMPAWGLKLDETTVKALTLYVHGLGGGS